MSVERAGPWETGKTVMSLQRLEQSEMQVIEAETGDIRTKHGLINQSRH